MHRYRRLQLAPLFLPPFRNEGDEKFPNFKTERVFLDHNPPTHEQGTDKPGRSYSSVGHGRSAVILNRFVAPNALFAGDPDLDLRFDPMLEKVRPRADAERIFSLDATKLAGIMLGNTIGANLLLVGYAWQRGLIPLQAESIMRACAPATLSLS